MTQCILITGATSAIGRALALEYAAPGVTLILQGRNEAVLAQLASQCEERGAHVRCHQLDLRDQAELDAWLDTLNDVPLDLVILNAGVNAHAAPGHLLESWEDTETLLDLNVHSSIRIAHKVVSGMQARGQGQLAFMSSLAAYHGLPVTPAYSASKAALKAYGESLRGALASSGVKVNVIMPGYVASPMAADMPGPKPWLWSPERAARVICRQLARNKARISFPFPLNWGCWWLAVLPAAWSQRIVRWAGYGG